MTGCVGADAASSPHAQLVDLTGRYMPCRGARAFAQRLSDVVTRPPRFPAVVDTREDRSSQRLSCACTASRCLAARARHGDCCAGEDERAAGDRHPGLARHEGLDGSGFHGAAPGLVYAPVIATRDVERPLWPGRGFAVVSSSRGFTVVVSTGTAGVADAGDVALGISS